MRRGGSVTLGNVHGPTLAPYASRAAIAVSIAWNGSWPRIGTRSYRLAGDGLA